MKPKAGLVIAGLSLVALTTQNAALAQVQGVHVLNYHNGENAGPENNVRGNGNNRGVGMEQLVVYALLHQDGSVSNEGVGIGMTSYTDQYNIAVNQIGIGNEDVVQGACLRYRVDAQAGPQIIPTNPAGTPITVMTNIDGDHGRTMFHPQFIPFPGGAEAAASGDLSKAIGVIVYNHGNNNNGDAENHALVINSMCQPLSPVGPNQQSLVLHINNDDCSHSTYGGPEDQGWQLIASNAAAGQFTIMGAPSCNGNNLDSKYDMMFRIEQAGNGQYRVAGGLDLDNLQEVNQAPNIALTENAIQRARGRVMINPSMNRFAPQNAGLIWSNVTDGNNDPPRNGETMATVRFDTSNMTVSKVSEQTLAKGSGRGIYATNGHLLSLTGGVVLFYNEVNDRGRRNNDNKARTTAMGGILNVDMATGNANYMMQPTTAALPGGMDGTHLGACTAMAGDAANPTKQAFLIDGSFNGSPNNPTTVHQMAIEGGTIAHVATHTMDVAIDKANLANYYGQNAGTQGRNFVQCGGNIANPGYGVPGGYASNVKSFVVVGATHRAADANGRRETKLSTSVAFVPAEVAGGTVGNGQPFNPDSGGTVGGLGACSATSSSSGLGALFLVGLSLLTIRRRRRA